MKFHDISFVDIALPDSSVDAIVAAHCFHWFANEEAVRDICRVLVPGGSLGMIWILPDESVPWVKELLTFFRPLENGFEHTTSEDISSSRKTVHCPKEFDNEETLAAYLR